MTTEEQTIDKSTVMALIRECLEDKMSCWDAILYTADDLDKEPEQIIKYIDVWVIERAKRDAIEKEIYTEQGMSLDEFFA